MKIINYQVIGALGTDQLEDMVYEAIKQGWQPIGGLSSCNVRGTTLHQQAMVEYSVPEIEVSVGAEL